MRVVRSPAAIVALIAATLAWAQSPSTVEPSRVLGLLCQGPTVWSGSPAAAAWCLRVSREGRQRSSFRAKAVSTSDGLEPRSEKGTHSP